MVRHAAAPSRVMWKAKELWLPLKGGLETDYHQLPNNRAFSANKFGPIGINPHWLGAWRPQVVEKTIDSAQFEYFARDLSHGEIILPWQLSRLTYSHSRLRLCLLALFCTAACLPSKATKRKKERSPWTRSDVATRKQWIGEGTTDPAVIRSKGKLPYKTPKQIAVQIRYLSGTSKFRCSRILYTISAIQQKLQ